MSDNHIIIAKMTLEPMSSPLKWKNSPHKWQLQIQVHVPESSNAEFASLKKDAPHSLPMSPHVTQAAGTAY
jgi:hypothetical protein